VEKLLLTASEAGAALGLGRSKVYELITSGQLASVRVGRSRRVPVEALRAFVAGLTADHRDAA
jgi:excisionase family DNA binding protein